MKNKTAAVDVPLPERSSILIIYNRRTYYGLRYGTGENKRSA